MQKSIIVALTLAALTSVATAGKTPKKSKAKAPAATALSKLGLTVEHANDTCTAVERETSAMVSCTAIVFDIEVAKKTLDLAAATKAETSSRSSELTSEELSDGWVIRYKYTSSSGKVDYVVKSQRTINSKTFAVKANVKTVEATGTAVDLFKAIR